ncbi:hypothetical protein GCM10012275_56110 [Longimycelium tulufanense]|uniref:HTH cro/C1-type domain-containing protein n=1 Tax=Longimycelium tulufanense TaxID=907463 RepID=A0A8J3CHY9_9PSEU|nr:ElyC/SanA/YdcF family protein [Longimycelium tulufanense]GGM78248.1 hypothetical protein GCM10012275_56110 [Longimycelium tulufanense]
MARRAGLIHARKTAGYTQEKFAAALEVAASTVVRWESGNHEPQPHLRPKMAKLLGVTLDELIELLYGSPASTAGSRDSLPLLATGSMDYETWEEDLDRVLMCLSRQAFPLGMKLANRWLAQCDPQSLDHHGLYLYGRSLVLLGHLRSDQGILRGPRSAQADYGRALQVFTQLQNQRRVAQVQLLLAVVIEMSGHLYDAARRYRMLADDPRLSPRDRARAQLWVGTALSKAGANDEAVPMMTSALGKFVRLDEAEDWSLAHQKLALAHRGLGDLTRATQYMDVALDHPCGDSPMQQVRRDTAHAHLLLSDPATRDEGFTTLERSLQLAEQHGLMHQAASIISIRQSAEQEDQRRGTRSIFVAPSVDNVVTDAHRRDAELIWSYHQVGHELRPCSAAIALGCYDLGVAAHAARLYHEGMFPVVVFTGANSVVSANRFPQGEASAFKERALELGVPEAAIFTEPSATNTGQNIELSRKVLQEAGIAADSVMLITMRYMERRAYATCAKRWPEVSIICASAPLSYQEYVATIGNEKLVIDDLVGDLQRILEYPKIGYAIPQDVPVGVQAAYERLVHAGFDSRLLTS